MFIACVRIELVTATLIISVITPCRYPPTVPSSSRTNGRSELAIGLPAVASLKRSASPSSPAAGEPFVFANPKTSAVTTHVPAVSDRSRPMSAQEPVTLWGEDVKDDDRVVRLGVAPVPPVAPVAPAEPVLPVGPVGPVAPVGPVVPDPITESTYRLLAASVGSTGSEMFPS